MKILILLLILVISVTSIAIGIGSIYTKHFERKRNPNKKLSITMFIIAGISILLMIFIPGGIEIVNTGEIAVVRVLGETKDVKTEGFYFRNIVTTEYEYYDLRTQDLRSDFEAYTKDGQAVKVQLTVQFRIKADKIIEINRTFGSLEVLKQRIDVVGIVGVKEVMSAENALDLIVNRQNISTTVSQNIGNILNGYHIDVTQILISDIAFTQTFEDMIEQKMLVQQQLEKAEVELQIQLQEAEYKVRIAVEQANERLAQAEGDADVMEALAQAEASKIQMIAEAEAEALQIKAQALSQLSEDATTYLKYLAWVEAWDGELPEIVLSENGNYIIPFN